MPTALFVDLPTPGDLESYGQVTAFGVAGATRAMPPIPMEAALTAAFAALRRYEPKFVHYKVCSTFDSSPQFGSIGRAIELGRQTFANRITPLLVAAPALARYCAFGNLFARSGLDSDVYRLDRHPTMATHPVTPMHEADLRRHLALQSDLRVELVDLLTLDKGVDAALVRIEHVADRSIVLFDAMHDEHLNVIGRVLQELQRREDRPLFLAGSSGIEHALLAACRDDSYVSAPAEADHAARTGAAAARVDRLLVLSGSCSPVTDRQIAVALASGFVEVLVDRGCIVAGAEQSGESMSTAQRVSQLLRAGKSVIVHSGQGARRTTLGPPVADQLGDFLGRVLCETLQSVAVERVVVAGGDTSGQVARAAGISALRMVAPLEPGAPLCAAGSSDPCVDGVQFVFKGGQVGTDRFFLTALDGSNRCEFPRHSMQSVRC